MKELLFILVVSILYNSCTNRTAGIHEISMTDSSSVSFPYSAAYSSRFSIGKDSSALAVLNNYKAWETGDMNAFMNTLGNSLSAYFSNATNSGERGTL